MRGAVALGAVAAVLAALAVPAAAAAAGPPDGASPSAPAGATFAASLATADPQPGEPFLVELMAAWPGELTADVPWLVEEELGGLKLITASPGPGNDPGAGILTRQIVFQAEERGFYVLPPWRLRLYRADGSPAGTLTTQPLPVEVPEGAADPSQLRPLKDPQAIPAAPPWGVLGVTAACLALAGLAWWWWHRRRAAVPAPDPFERLEADLAAFTGERSPDAPLDKEAAYRLSFVLRRFVAGATGVPAPEMTGAELSEAIERRHRELAGGDAWRELVGHLRTLEEIKYQPPSVADQPLSEWLAPVRRWRDAIRQARAEADATTTRTEAEVRHG